MPRDGCALRLRPRRCCAAVPKRVSVRERRAAVARPGSTTDRARGRARRRWPRSSAAPPRAHEVRRARAAAPDRGQRRSGPVLAAVAIARASTRARARCARPVRSRPRRAAQRTAISARLPRDARCSRRSATQPYVVVGPWFFEQPTPGYWGRRLARWRKGAQPAAGDVRAAPSRCCSRPARARRDRLPDFDMPGTRTTHFLGKPAMLADGTRATRPRGRRARPAAARSARTGHRVRVDVSDPLDPRDIPAWRRCMTRWRRCTSVRSSELPRDARGPARGFGAGHRARVRRSSAGAASPPSTLAPRCGSCSSTRATSAPTSSARGSSTRRCAPGCRTRRTVRGPLRRARAARALGARRGDPPDPAARQRRISTSARCAGISCRRCARARSCGASCATGRRTSRTSTATRSR